MISWLLGGELGAQGGLAWSTSPGTVALAAVVAGLAWVLAIRSGRKHEALWRLQVLEAVAWAVALAVLLVAVAGPTWVEEEGRVEPGKVVILVDGSASMGVVEAGEPRSARVDQLLSRLSLDGSGVELYTFDESLRAGLPAGYDGRSTDLGVALAALSDRYLGQQLRGVVLLTDGLDRGALRREWLEDPTQALGSLAPTLPGPLTIYQVGSATELVDLAIEDVSSGGFAFLRTPFEMVASLRGRPGEEVTVTLSREGRLVRTVTATLDEEGRGEAAFQVVPTQVGRFAWELSVPVAEDDAVPGNNTFPVVVRVVRDRTRVLQVSGSPSYDQKFLRLFLKEDPSVDLVSFFILRTHEDMSAGWSSQEISLISFPYEKLFTEELDSFDLVIFQNFDYAPYFEWGSRDLLSNISEYVQNGGAFVMTGGDRSYDLGRYAGTPIAEILPVHLGVVGETVDVAPFRPVVSVAGTAHPITRLSGDGDENARVWERLPAMDGLNLSLGLQKGAASLLTHPGIDGPDGQPMPVLAVREVGKGRSMALTVDSSWRWSFTEAGAGRGNQAYLRFWKNAMRWLVADPDDQRMVVAPSRENVLLGDEVRLSIKVRDTGYGPVEGAQVRGRIMAPDGVLHPFEAVTDASGEARTTFEPTLRGAHRVVVEAGRLDAETVFAVTARDPELVEILPDGPFLQALAASYGAEGEWRGPADASAPLLDPDAGRTVMDRRETQLATAPLVALLFGLFGSLGWWARRRRGGR